MTATLTVQHNLNAINVKDYGAVGNGTTDDTVAIQTAITAAKTSGGIVLLPPGTYLISSALNISGNGNGIGTFIIQGVGWASIIKIKNNTNIYAFDMMGVETWNICIRDLKIDCNGVNQTSAGGGVYARGSVNGKFQNLWIHSPYNEGVNIGPIAIGQTFSHHNLIDACLIDGGASIPSGGTVYGVYTFSTEENIIRHCQFENLGNPAVSEPHACFDNSTHNLWHGNNFLVTPTGVNSLGMQGIQSMIISNIFDGGNGHCVHVTRDNCLIESNIFYAIGSNQISSGNAKAGVYVSIGGVSNARIIGNSFEPCDSGVGYADSGIFLDGSTKNCIVANNDLVINQSSGSWVNGPIHTTGLIGTGNVFRSNPGYNPVGQVTAPTFPTSTAAASNNTGSDVTAFVANGAAAITQVQIAGASGSYVNTNYQIAASGWGAVRLPAGSSVKFTYGSGTPTWIWMGD